MTLRRLHLRVDVSESVKRAGKIEIAATVFLPDFASLTDRPIAIFAIPGGGYSRGYFDLQFPQHRGYSEAEYYAQRGLILVALDHLGVGESTLSDLHTLRIEDIAAANDAAVQKIAGAIIAGTLTDDFPAVPSLSKVGIGQSMGGGVTLIMQGRHRSYDAIACLGYSAIHTVLQGNPAYGMNAGRDADPASLTMPVASIRMTDLRRLFHWEDVPQEILTADMEGYPFRSTPQPWGSNTMPNCAIAMTSPGYVASEAAAIEVPVLLAMGERDVVPSPMNEPSAFRKAKDVSVFIVPRMAHMHNFASTREILWARIAAWARMVNGSGAPRGLQK